MNKELPIITTIKEVVVKALVAVRGRSEETASDNSNLQDRPLSENSIREIENMSIESKF